MLIKTAPLIILSASLSALLLACGGETVDLNPGNHVRSELIAADTGGSITVTESDAANLAGVAIEIPAGALATDTTITVDDATELTAESETEWTGPTVQFGPAGLSFQKPVTVRLRTTQSFDASEARVRVVSADGTSEWIEADAITVADGGLSFEIDHFTRFRPGHRRRTPPPPPGCQTDSDCARGEVCNLQTFACEVAPPPPPPPNGCQSDADCARGQQFCNLQTNMCESLPPPPPPGCQTDADCARGEVCNVRTFVCEAPPPPPPGCQSDADCARGEVCNQQTLTCEVPPPPPPPNGCQSDADCARGQQFCNPQTNMCESLPPPPPPGCQTDADCAQGQVCNVQTSLCEAVPPPNYCRLDTDCPQGQLCNQQTNICQ